MEVESPTTVSHQNYLLLASAVALLTGFLLLYILISNSKTRRKSTEIRRKCVGDDGLQLTETDVIIVGAGVAGAALACTLAKFFTPVQLCN
ncbi:putative FAD/NAD(P)-binding domain superfamily [Helianthus anomalus]